MNSLLLPLLFAVLPLAALAETPPPARTMMSDAPASPLILPDGRVTFRCRAPQAREVKVSGQFGKEALMEKADDGWWTVTIGPAPAGVHEYHFTVDGMNIIDHLNPMVKPQRNPGSSILHIPANPPARPLGAPGHPTWGGVRVFLSIKSPRKTPPAHGVFPARLPQRWPGAAGALSGPWLQR